MINSFHKDYPNKLTAIFLVIDTAPPLAKPITKPIVKLNKPATKRKHSCLAKSINKRAKN